MTMETRERLLTAGGSEYSCWDASEGFLQKRVFRNSEGD
jgi:hypothetical protein